MAKKPGDAFTWGDAKEYTKALKQRYPQRDEVTEEITEARPRPMGRVDIITCITGRKDQ